MFGISTVAKKDGMLRLVFDRRIASALCRAPPMTNLSTAGAFCSLDLSGERMADESGDLEGCALRAAALDQTDTFHQLGWEALAGYFALDTTMAAQEAEIEEVWNGTRTLRASSL